jgi:hypothetical protein
MAPDQVCNFDGVIISKMATTVEHNFKYDFMGKYIKYSS